MCKMKLIAITILLAIGVLCSEGYCSDKIIMLPKQLSKIKLGMSYTELKQMFPKARDAVGKPEEEILVFDYLDNIKDSDIWQSIAYDFKNGKLVSISLLREDRIEEKPYQYINNVIRVAIAEYGEKYSKKISLDPNLIPNPVLVWDEKTFKVYLCFSPIKHNEKQIRNSIRLTFALPERKFQELFSLPTFDLLEQKLFDLLIINQSR